jgi:hypothetical protein
VRSRTRRSRSSASCSSARGAPALGDVARAHLARLADLVAERRRPHLDLDLRSVQPQAAHLRRGLRLRRAVGRVGPGLPEAAVVGVDMLEHRPADQLRRVARAEQAQRGRVHVDEAAVAHEEDGVGRRIHQRTVAALAARQRLLVAVALPQQHGHGRTAAQHQQQQAAEEQPLAVAADGQRRQRLVLGKADDDHEVGPGQPLPGVQPHDLVDLADGAEQAARLRTVAQEVAVGRQRAAHGLQVVAAARDEGAVGVHHRHHVARAQRRRRQLLREVVGAHGGVHRAVEAAVAQQRPVGDEDPAVGRQPRAHGTPDMQAVHARALGAEVVSVGDADALGGVDAVVDRPAVSGGHGDVAQRVGRLCREHRPDRGVELRRPLLPLAAQLQQRDVDAAEQRLRLRRQGVGQLLRPQLLALDGLVAQRLAAALGLQPQQRGGGGPQQKQQHGQPDDQPAAALRGRVGGHRSGRRTGLLGMPRV